MSAKPDDEMRLPRVGNLDSVSVVCRMCDEALPCGCDALFSEEWTPLVVNRQGTAYALALMAMAMHGDHQCYEHVESVSDYYDCETGYRETTLKCGWCKKTWEHNGAWFE